MAIPAAYIEELTGRSDIVDIIGGFVELKRKGRLFTGLCPFHNEKTPSFTVYPDTNSFYCFGCGAAGDVISFVRKINNLSYVEAVRFLASRAGMPMPDEDDEAGKLRGRVLAANREAARFFYASLNAQENGKARAYWRGRGLSDATIRRFGLGFAPDSFGALRDHLRGKGFAEDELVAAGLARKNDKGNVYDMFRGRVTVPIFDIRGNVIAFGARAMGDEKPKYINSPETPVYRKNATVFALNLARSSGSRRYILCEGYMDVISLHQAGFSTAVAGCGTALTAGQVRLLSDYADEVVLCYDADEAGRKATEKAMALFAQTPVRLTVLNIPDGKDPDEFIRKNGAGAFELLLSGAANAVEYELGRARGKHDLTAPDGRVEYLKEAVGILAGPMSATQRAVYAGTVAEECAIPRSALEQQLERRLKAERIKAEREREKRLLGEGAAGRIKVAPGTGTLGGAYAEQQLLAALVRRPDRVAAGRQELTPEAFTQPGLGEAYTALLHLTDQGAAVSLSTLTPHIAEDTATLLARLLADGYDLPATDEDIALYMERMRRARDGPARAASLSGQELEAYLNELKQKKK